MAAYFNEDALEIEEVGLFPQQILKQGPCVH